MSRLLPAVLLLCACFPPELDETGKRCDPVAGRSCGEGYTCFDFICVATDAVDAGPDNWLPNPDFENLNDAGNLIGWHATAGAVEPDPVLAHQGKYSARLFSDDGGTPSLITNVVPVKGTLKLQTWCAKAWVRTESVADAGINVALFIRERHDDGGTNDSSPSRPKVYGVWVSMEESYVTEGAEKLDCRVTFNTKPKKNEQIWVDEIRLKRSATGVCSW